MSISSNGRFIVDTHLNRISGFRVAGGYGLRLGVDFTTASWDDGAGPVPVVVMHPAVVEIAGPTRILLGRAVPERPQLFTVTKHALGPIGAGFELVLSKGAFEELEQARNGGELNLNLRLCAEVRQGSSVLIEHDDLLGAFNQSHWLGVLDGCGYQRTVLFEIPLPEAASGSDKWLHGLQAARKHVLAGHYVPAVSSCRMALESLNQELGQVQTLKDVVDKHKKQRKDLDVAERELIIRQAAFDFSSLSVHSDTSPPEALYDRAYAQMLLAVTASLISSALTRRAEAARRAAEDGGDSSAA